MKKITTYILVAVLLTMGSCKKFFVPIWRGEALAITLY